jgi:hypothetical protein
MLIGTFSLIAFATRHINWLEILSARALFSVSPFDGVQRFMVIPPSGSITSMMRIFPSFLEFI